MDNQVAVFVNQEEVSNEESTASIIPSPSSGNQMADDIIPWYQVPGSIVVSQEEKLYVRRMSGLCTSNYK